MKTYQETVRKLALASAHNYLSGNPNTQPDGLGTIAWIYGVKENAILRDMKKLENEAYQAAMKGERYV